MMINQCSQLTCAQAASAYAQLACKPTVTGYVQAPAFDAKTETAFPQTEAATYSQTALAYARSV